MANLPSILLTATMAVAMSGPLVEAAGADAPGAHRTIAGTVTDIKSGMVFVKTVEGTTRNFSTKQVRQERLKDVRVGDRVTLALNEDNMLVDLKPMGESETPQATISGQLIAFDRLEKTATLSTEEGQRVSYVLKEAAALKLAGKKLGDRVTLEIDQDNHLAMDVVN